MHLFCHPGIAKVLAVERDAKLWNMTFAKVERGGGGNREGAFILINMVSNTSLIRHIWKNIKMNNIMLNCAVMECLHIFGCQIPFCPFRPRQNYIRDDRSRECGPPPTPLYVKHNISKWTYTLKWSALTINTNLVQRSYATRQSLFLAKEFLPLRVHSYYLASPKWTIVQ